MSPISFSFFPEEVLLNIFDYLNPKELAKSGQVCRKWYQLSQDYTLWKKFTQAEKKDTVQTWKSHVVTEILSKPFLGLYSLNNQLYLLNGFKFHVFPLLPPFHPASFVQNPRHEITSRITCFWAWFRNDQN